MPITISGSNTTPIYFKQEDSLIKYSNNNNDWTTLQLTDWPITFTNSSSQVLTISIQTDLNFNSSSQNFLINSSNITFDGTNKNIIVTDVSNYSGLIFSQQTNSIIKNIRVISVNSSLSFGQGWICRSNSQNCEIINCSSNGDIIGGSGSACGGIAGNEISNTIIRNCFSEGNIIKDSGGIIGFFCENCSIFNCYSTGNISDNSGGIIGILNGLSGTIFIKECYSTGQIGETCGGIVGGLSVNINVEKCYSTGNISTWAGGIFSANSSFSLNLIVKNSYSTGSINNQGGGIFGFGSDVSGQSIAENCYSTGDINSGGGIFSNNFNGAKAKNCYTSGLGDFSSPYVGGIFGNNKNDNPPNSENNYSEVNNNSSGWNKTNASNVLIGSPSSNNLIGEKWVDLSTTEQPNQPFFINEFGISPYSLNYISNPTLNLLVPLSNLVSFFTFSEFRLLNISPQTDLISFQQSNGMISFESNIELGIYVLYIFSFSHTYNITKLTLKIGTDILNVHNQFFLKNSNANIIFIKNTEDLVSNLQWQFSNDNIIFSDISNANNTSLLINNFTNENIGFYRINYFSNSTQYTSNTSRIELLEITDQSTSQIININISTFITLSVDYQHEKTANSLELLIFNWQVYSNNSWTNIEENDNYSFNSELNKEELIISNLSLEFNGLIYRCEISKNTFNNSYYSEEITINTYETLEITTQPTSLFSQIDSEISFSVSVYGGFSEISYQWQKRGSYNDEINQYSWSNITNANNSLFELIANEENIGYYRCKITDELETTIYSNIVNLTIYNIIQNISDIYRTINNLDIVLESSIIILGETPSFNWQIKSIINDETIWTNINEDSIYSFENLSENNIYTKKLIINPNINLNNTSFRLAIQSHQIIYLNNSNGILLTIYPELEITEQSSNNFSIFNENSSIEFSVSIGGGQVIDNISQVNYQWQRGKITNNQFSWSNVSNETNNNLSLSHSNTISEFLYRCIINDNYGASITSNEFKIILIDYTDIPILVEKTQGISEINFDINPTIYRYSEDEIINYQWQISNGTEFTDISNETNSTLTIENPLRTDYNSKSIRCKISTNIVDSVNYSSISEITIFEPISFTKNISDKILKINDELLLEIEVTGGETIIVNEIEKSNVEYIWQFATLIDNEIVWNNIGNSNRNQYQIEEVSNENAKRYRCKISDPNGIINYSNIIDVIIIDYTEPDNKYVLLSHFNSTSFSVGELTIYKFSQTNEPNYFWEMGQQIDGNVVFTQIENSKLSTINLENLTISSNNKNYRLKITFNNQILTTQSALLNIYETFEIISQPTDIILGNGEFSILEVEVSFINPLVSFQWYKLIDNQYTNLENTINISGVNTNILQLNHNISNSGNYKLIITINAPESETLEIDTFNIIIINITEHPEYILRTEGVSSISFTTDFEGTNLDDINLVWQKKTEEGWEDFNIENTKTLIISSPNHNDYNNTYYRVKITKENYSGIVYSIFDDTENNYGKLIINEPIIISGLSNNYLFRNLGTTDVVFEPIIEGGTDVTFQWQRQNQNTTNALWTNITNATNSNYSFDASSSDVNFNYRLVATDIYSGYTVSNTIRFILIDFNQETSIFETEDGVTNLSISITNLSVNVPTNSNQTLNYQWQNRGEYNEETEEYSWTNISGATSSTYSFIPTHENDNGRIIRLRITRTNFTNIIYSSNILLTIYPKIIVSSSFNRLNFINNNTTFLVEVEREVEYESPVINYQWQRGIINSGSIQWTDIENETNSSLIVSGESDENGEYLSRFRYRVRVYDDFYQVNSGVYNLVLIENTELTDISYTEGTSNSSFSTETINIYKFSSETNSLNIQWQIGKEEEGELEWTNITNKNSTTYLEDNGKKIRYLISKTGYQNTLESNKVNLEIFPRIVISEQPISQIKKSNTISSFTVEIETENINENIQYQWYRRETTEWEEVGDNSNELLLEDNNDYKYSYRVKIFDDTGFEIFSNIVNLIIVDYTSITNKNFTEGQSNFTFNINPTVYKLTSITNISYSWFLIDGEDVTEVSTGSSYILEDITVNSYNGKSLRLEINKDGFNSLISETVSISVFPPILIDFSSNPKNYLVTFGTFIDFTITISGGKQIEEILYNYSLVCNNEDFDTSITAFNIDENTLVFSYNVEVTNENISLINGSFYIRIEDDTGYVKNSDSFKIIGIKPVLNNMAIYNGIRRFFIRANHVLYYPDTTSLEFNWKWYKSTDNITFTQAEDLTLKSNTISGTLVNQYLDTYWKYEISKTDFQNSFISNVAEIKNNPLIITPNNRNRYLGLKNKDITLGMTVKGGTAPYSYYWKKNNKLIENGSKYEDSTTNSLVINSLVLEDYGTYTCIVTDAEDVSVENSINLDIAELIIITPMEENILERFAENEIRIRLNYSTMETTNINTNINIIKIDPLGVVPNTLQTVIINKEQLIRIPRDFEGKMYIDINRLNWFKPNFSKETTEIIEIINLEELRIE